MTSRALVVRKPHIDNILSGVNNEVIKGKGNA